MIEMKVIGIGSPYGDDQVGWNIIEKLQQRNTFQRFYFSSLMIESYNRPNVRLLEYMSDTKTVILIDAVVSGRPIGSICRLQNHEIEECKFLISTHDFGVTQALQLGKSLNSLPENIILFGIEIDSEYSGDTLSPFVEASTELLVECIEAEIMVKLGCVT